jgi:cytochrome c oxidase subunit 1
LLRTMRAELARPGTDHKLIGRMYMVAAFVFFMLGGVMALLMQFLSPEQYNHLFTMHGTIMLLLFATPLVFGFANLVLPLQIGSPDVACPRLNVCPTGCTCSMHC